ncbi:MAG: hypothetical protein HKN40_07005 [Winogradskyella sp.]|uniref:hypothetical protein n=1 Tax=Winogradskyella sp. TaxID=1883156 RepID=UPI0017AA0374|nr:hypothetical protein [Winogradskyella sp.]
MKTLFTLITLFLVSCGGSESAGASGGSCTVCYESTTLTGEPSVVCRDQEGIVCF